METDNAQPLRRRVRAVGDGPGLPAYTGQHCTCPVCGAIGPAVAADCVPGLAQLPAAFPSVAVEVRTPGGLGVEGTSAGVALERTCPRCGAAWLEATSGELDNADEET